MQAAAAAALGMHEGDAVAETSREMAERKHQCSVTHWASLTQSHHHDCSHSANSAEFAWLASLSPDIIYVVCKGGGGRALGMLSSTCKVFFRSCSVHEPRCMHKKYKHTKNKF